MDILTIVQYASYGIALLVLISLPIRLALFSKKTGSCLLQLRKTKMKLFIIVIALAIAMLVVLHFRAFSVFVAGVLHATALLAIEMGVREYINRAKSGVYEKALVADGKFIKKNEVVLLPTLEYETESSNILDIVTEKRGTISIFFETVNERNDATSIVKTWQQK